MFDAEILDRRTFGQTGFEGARNPDALLDKRFFGDVGDYAPCGCCGGFHSAVVENGLVAESFLNADSRGGGVRQPNGKVSFNPTEAGAHITRGNLFWDRDPGQPTYVSFAFRSIAPITMPNETQGFSRFNEVQIAATLLALAAWSDVANIVFTRVDNGDGYSNNAVMLFGNYSSGSEGSAAFAYLPANRSITSASGDVWVNNSLSYNANPQVLNYGSHVLVHEIGHAIGLRHPGAYNAEKDQTLTYAEHAEYYEDSRQYSVMSYFSATNTGANHLGRYSAVPLLDDIVAVQRLYGANMSTRTGDTVYGFDSNAGHSWFSATNNRSVLIFAVWDAGGIDTFNFSGFDQNQIIDLRQGAFSDIGGFIGNVAIAMNVVIENAIGGWGNDIIRGNSADNILTGGRGDDTIDGGEGVDTAVFSGLRSAYTITWNQGTATVVGPDGRDTLTNIQFLKFDDQTVAAPSAPTGGVTLNGDNGSNVLTGTAFADVLNGLGGDDILRGLDGNDVLDGGDGNDILIGGRGSDRIIGGAGHDRALYDGLVRGYATAAGGLNGFTVRGGVEGGTDTITGVESIEFLDGRFSFEADSLYAVVYRMYDAAFDRGPDVFGMRTWTDELARGTPLSRLSDVFEASPEFQRRYGALNNTDFIKEMYRFSLDREADAGGLAHWEANLARGMSRAEVLYHFSESQEHKAVMEAKILAQGMWIQDEATFLIARMYDAALNRNADLAGLKNWRAEMSNGLTEMQLAQAFMTSQEFQTRFGALNNQQYVEMLYQTALGRAGDAQGVADWTARLNSGTSRAEMLLIFATSDENKLSYFQTWQQVVRNFETGLHPATAPEQDGTDLLQADLDAATEDEGLIAEVSRFSALIEDDFLPANEAVTEAADTHLVPEVSAFSAQPDDFILVAGVFDGADDASGASVDALVFEADLTPAAAGDMAGLNWLQGDDMPRLSLEAPVIGLEALNPRDDIVG